MAPTPAPRSLLRQLRLPLVRLAPDGSVIEATPEVGQVIAREELMTEIRADALVALSMVAKRTHQAPSWLAEVPRMAPRFRVHGTVVAGELHRFEAVLIIIPANGDPMVQHPPSLADEARGLLKDWGLTRRESEVALLVAQGWSSPRIAVEMHVTVHTVRRHTEAVFRKLQVHNRAELARLVGEISGRRDMRQSIS